MEPGEAKTPLEFSVFDKPKVSRWIVVTLIVVIILAAGFFVWYYQMGPGKSMEKVSTTIASGEVPAPDPTVDWQTYTNTKYLYTFKYPSTVALTSASGNADSQAINGTAAGVNVAVTGAPAGEYIFSISIPGISLTDAAIRQQFGATAETNIAITSETIGGNSGKKVVISGDASVVSTFYFVQNTAGTVLEITVLNSSTDASAILASLAFGPTTSATADWKTFANTTYKYSLLYPAGWSVSSIGDATTEAGASITNDNVNYSLGISVVSSQSSLDDFVANLKSSEAAETAAGHPGNTYGDQTNTTIGGQPAIKLANSTQGASAYRYDEYFVKKGSNIYQLNITKIVGEGDAFDPTSYIATAETMLTTFQFTS